MAKHIRRLAALTLAFGILPTHLAIATSAAPIPEVTDSPGTNSLVGSLESDPADAPPGVELPNLYIRAVSPGYNGNTGEFIELLNSTADLISLDGLSLWYNNGKKDYLVLDFPENSFLSPGSLVLRLQSSPEVKNATDLSEVAHLTYAKDLAMSGSLRLVIKSTSESSDSTDVRFDANGNLILDELCWLGGETCATSFTSSAPTILVRDPDTGEPEHLETYEPDFSPRNYQIITPPELEDDPSPSDEPTTTDFDDSGLATADDSASTLLTETSLAPCPEGKYRNPETNRCKKIEEEPEEKTCSEGYYLNESTNRCNKIKETTEKTCEEGYYLNTATNRCNKLPTEKEQTPCKEGYERNPETNRCRKIVSDTTEEKTCAEGYYLNPETNRCNKIKVNDGADYAIVPTTGGVEQNNFLGLWILLAIAALGFIVVIFQFRHEIFQIFKKLKSGCHPSKHLL